MTCDDWIDYRALYPEDELPRELFERMPKSLTFAAIHKWYVTPQTSPRNATTIYT